MIDKAIGLDPHHPFSYSFWRGHCLMYLGRDEEALAVFRRAINRAPNMLYVHQHEAALLVHLGRLDEARAAAAGRHSRKLPLRGAAFERFLDGLRRAGLPE